MTTTWLETPSDILRHLDERIDPSDEKARATANSAAELIRHLLQQRNELQSANTRLALENRALRAASGRPLVSCMRVGDHDLPLPRYETEGAAGMDLRADVRGMERVGLHCVRSLLHSDNIWRLTIYPGGRALIPCGFAFEIPPGFEGQVRGRSSLTKRGALCPTGTIDSDYRGVVSTYVWNLSAEAIEIAQGDRISQLILAQAPQARIVMAEALSATARNDGGYGSTGTR